MAMKPKPKPPAAPKGPMTKTVIRKVSPNVKVIKPGSRPRTQSATEKAAMVAKAKTKTPAKRADAAITKKNADWWRKNNIKSIRSGVMKDTYFGALKDGGFDALGKDRDKKPSPAQVKAANKAVAEAQRDFKEKVKASTAKKKAATKAEFRTRSRMVGGMRGGGGGAGIMGFNDVNK
jgi:hypothetical protein